MVISKSYKFNKMCILSCNTYMPNMKKINIIVITEISNKRTNYEVSLLDDALKKIVGPQEWWKS